MLDFALATDRLVIGLVQNLSNRHVDRTDIFRLPGFEITLAVAGLPA